METDRSTKKSTSKRRHSVELNRRHNREKAPRLYLRRRQQWLDSINPIAMESLIATGDISDEEVRLLITGHGHQIRKVRDKIQRLTSLRNAECAAEDETVKITLQKPPLAATARPMAFFRRKEIPLPKIPMDAGRRLEYLKRMIRLRGGCLYRLMELAPRVLRSEVLLNETMGLLNLLLKDRQVTALDMQLLRRAQEFHTMYETGRRHYTMAVSHGMARRLEGDWALFDSSQLDTLLDNIREEIPGYFNNSTQFLTNYVVHRRTHQHFLDIYGPKEGPLLRISLNHEL